MNLPLWFANSGFPDLTPPSRDSQNLCAIDLNRLYYLHLGVLDRFTKGINDYLLVGRMVRDFVLVHPGGEDGQITIKFHQNRRDVVALMTILSPQKG